MKINLPIKVNLTRLRAMFGQLALFIAAVAACGVPGWAAAQSILSFTVVNADTGVDIATYTDSGTVSVATTPRINIRANATGVKSVVFTTRRSWRASGGRR